MSHIWIRAAFGLAACFPLLVRAAAPVPDDAGCFRELQQIAARRPAETDEVARRLVVLLRPIWKKPEYRHRVAHVLNLNGGHLDRVLNRFFLGKLRARGIDIPNESRLDARVMRGGQPDEKGFRRLKDLGVRTVVNLRLEDNGEEPLVRSLGMEPVWIPIGDTVLPTAAQIDRFQRIMRDPSSGIVFFHCAGGVNRTGLMAAIWRMENGWHPGRALREARRFGFDENLLGADRQLLFIQSYRPGR